MNKINTETDQNLVHKTQELTTDAEFLPPLRLTRPILFPPIDIHVLASSEETNALLRKVQKLPACARMRWKYRPHALTHAHEIYAREDTPPLLLIENDADDSRILETLTGLSHHCATETKVIILNSRSVSDIALIRDVFKLGVSEFLLPPFTPTDILSVLADVTKNLKIYRQGLVTAFLGARGGAGSSVMAQNVASIVSASLKMNVVLADMDHQHGSVAQNFDIEDAYTISEVIRRRSPIDEVLMERLLTKVTDDLKLLLVDPSLDNSSTLTAPAINSILELANSSRRHVLLDMPHIWGRRTAKTLSLVDKVVLTSEPTLNSLRSCKTTCMALRRVIESDNDIAIVVNKRGIIGKEEVPAQAFRDLLEIPHVYEVPFDPSAFAKAHLDGASVAQKYADHPVTNSIRVICEFLNREGPYHIAEHKPAGLMSKLKEWW